jgi:pseudouridine synthase
MKTFKVTTSEPVRINAFLRDHGVGSRRAIDTFIEEGNVSINGARAILGSKVKHGDTVVVKEYLKDMIYAMYNKPRGEVTGRLEKLPGCEPLGRLDKESNGLLLYSNDYRLVDALLNPKHGREKEYEVVVREKATPRVITLLKKGIKTQETTYAPVEHVSIHGEGHGLTIILTEGKKHEIRRMLNALNLTVVSLRRVRILSFSLHGLKSGQIHHLTPKQVKRLFADCSIT